MTSACGGGRTLSQFALVSYLPGPLAAFLDRLRLDMDPGCRPHAHVTILPPRPFTGEIREAIDDMTKKARLIEPIEILLGDVDVFPFTNVLYIGLELGEPQIRQLHSLLDSGSLKFCCPFDFHPHITVAQELTKDNVQEAARLARGKWAEYKGSRRFLVESLSFVQNVAPYVWVDLAKVPLASAVPACR
jgi:2'-5' RNA ligase